MAELTPVVVCLSDSGLATARKAAAALGADLHGRAGRVMAADAFFDNAINHLRDLFASGRPIVGICAAGILIRAVGPMLADKRAEPAVLAVAEDAPWREPHGARIGAESRGVRGGDDGRRRLAGRGAGRAAGGVAAGESGGC
jgi:cobalt-precorrin 5A hydrolase/precorrin-3B C17-methyltransferase